MSELTINEIIKGKRVLHLTLKKKWFDEIASGEKKVEYRGFKHYWATRLGGAEYDVIIFRNGYSKNSPVVVVACNGIRLRKAWLSEGHGAPGIECYCIALGEILYRHGGKAA